MLPLLFDTRARAAAAGLALGLAFHLAADVFPGAMVGFATVKLPLLGSIGARLSYLWLAGNALAGAALFGVLLGRLAMPRWLRAVVIGGGGAMGLGYLLRVDGGWWALASILLIGSGLSRLRD